MVQWAAMSKQPTVRFLSLFVPDLEIARAHYSVILGVEPVDADEVCLQKHPFAASGPVVFDLGSLKLALYRCDMKGTHPGDVGIGLDTGEAAGEVAARARRIGANVFFGPKPVAGQQRELAVFMTQDRHFFEVASAKKEG